MNTVVSFRAKLAEAREVVEEVPLDGGNLIVVDAEDRQLGENRERTRAQVDDEVVVQVKCVQMRQIVERLVVNQADPIAVQGEMMQ